MTTNKPVLVSQTKWLHKGALFGQVSNGGGEIPLDNGFALKFIASEKFCQINLIHHGKGIDVPYQQWQKVKEVQPDKEKIKESQVKLTDKVEEEILI